jgi:hypothetical protein
MYSSSNITTPSIHLLLKQTTSNIIVETPPFFLARQTVEAASVRPINFLEEEKKYGAK